MTDTISPFISTNPSRSSIPLIGDPAPSFVAKSTQGTLYFPEDYGMTHPEAKRGKSLMDVFFIDRDNKVRAIYFYPAEVGRSTKEIKRTLLALQKADDDFNVATQANWKPGDPVMNPYPTPLMPESMQPKTHCTSSTTDFDLHSRTCL